MSEPLISSTDRGLYCAAADVHIDAWRPVDRNIITHAHSDHARTGSTRYLCASDSAIVLRQRLGQIQLDTLDYGQSVDINGVKISLHPAGHVLGSAQVRVEHKGEVWVVTGDYKRQADLTCRAFEIVRCLALITECTFGLPVYRWHDPMEIAAAMNAWWRENQAIERTCILMAYSLGKAQRVLSMLDAQIGPILAHGAVMGMIEAYRQSGVSLPPVEHASPENAKLYRGRAMVIAPSSALAGTWSRKFGAFSLGSASGWMQIRGFRRRSGVDHGFVLSDHVDWPALLQTITETGATRVFATHGYTAPLTRALLERGYDAAELQTEFGAGEDESDAPPPTTNGEQVEP